MEQGVTRRGRNGASLHFLALALLLHAHAGYAAAPGPGLDDVGPFDVDPEGLALERQLDGQLDGQLDTGLNDCGCDLSQLVDGVQFPEEPELYSLWDPHRAWGTRRMVDTLSRVTEEMRWRFPAAPPLIIGDVSHEHGGVLQGHRSHRAGVDADVGIYFLADGRHENGLVVVDPSDLDLAADLAFVRALFATGEVERILLDQRLIRALRSYAIDSGKMTEADAWRMFVAPGDPLSASVWSLDQVVQHVPGHEHHFHVRVRCGE